METCINHPTREATTRCKACHKPLCDKCKLVTPEGVFCSEECHQRQQEFTKRAEQVPMPKRNFFRAIMGWVKKMLFLLVILVIAYVVIILIYGSPEGFFGQIRKLVNILF